MSKKTVVIMNILISFLCIISWNLHATNKTLEKKMLSFVLTNNPEKNEMGINIGCTYKAVPAFSNPADPKHTRLLDSDKPYNWNTTTGVNTKKQNVILDFKYPCRIDMVKLLFDKPQKPASVEVFVSDSVNGPWKSVGKMLNKNQSEIWWQLELKDVKARYVKLFHKLDKWGWYLREVKIYGNMMVADADNAKIVDNKLVLIEDGIPCSTIVVSDKPSSRVLAAALVFQSIAKRMTDAWIPIKMESNYDGKSAAIYVGDSKAVRERGIKVTQKVSDGDHYVIVRGGDYLALVGNDAPEYYWGLEERWLRGSVYAAYHTFETLDCGWFGPDPLWQVIPKRKTLSVPPIKLDERPAFLWRRAGMTGMKSEELRDAWREGGITHGGGHAYYRLVPPEKYKKKHPEWFGKGQPDITHPEVIALVVKNLRKKIDSFPAPMIVPFSFSSNDSGGYAVNERTKKIGNISAQQLYFANEVAKELNKTHPGRFRLLCLAYWHSHSPPKPMMKAEPGVHVMIVNEGNHTKPLDIPESKEIASSTSRNNTRELKAINGWLETGALTGIYEWYIPVIGNKIWADMPWQPGELTLRNLRFWKSKDIRFVYYESQKERNGGFPLRWPVYYQAYRGMWNPELTAKEIMTEACQKLYGPASKAMVNYYAVFEKAMLETDVHVGNWALPQPDKVYTPAIEKQADQWLAEAEKTATDKLAKKRIAVEKELWVNAKSILAKERETQEAQTYAVILDGKKIDYKNPMITRKLIIALFGLPDDAKIEIVEKDGQNRLMLNKEKIDLRLGVVFQIVK